MHAPLIHALHAGSVALIARSYSATPLLLIAVSHDARHARPHTSAQSESLVHDAYLRRTASGPACMALNAVPQSGFAETEAEAAPDAEAEAEAEAKAATEAEAGAETEAETEADAVTTSVDCVLHATIANGKAAAVPKTTRIARFMFRLFGESNMASCGSRCSSSLHARSRTSPRICRIPRRPRRQRAITKRSGAGAEENRRRAPM